MAASDSIPVPRKNTAFRLYFAIRKNDGTLITTWAGQDSEVSLDGAAFADCTNEATEIGTSGCGYIDFTAAEMNADNVVYKLTVTNTSALPIVVVLFPETAGDYRVADTQKVDVETIKTQALTAAAGITFPTSIASPTNITAATGITVATNSDKTGYSLTGTTGLGNQTANITGNLSGSVGSVTGNVGGNVTGSVGSVTGLTASNLDATISSRMATYTQPTGFLAATFPSDPADHSIVIAATDAILTAVGTRATPTDVSDTETAILAKLPDALVDGRMDSVLGDTTHGGTDATLLLKYLGVTATDTDEPAVQLTGNGTSPGLFVAGGTNGAGIYSLGSGYAAGLDVQGGLNADGIKARSGGDYGFGICSNGKQGGARFWASSGETPGMLISGAGDGGTGLSIIGYGEANGMLVTATGIGNALQLIAGTDGTGLSIAGGTDSGPAMRLHSYSGAGLNIVADDGHGVSVNATEGFGIQIFSTRNSIDVYSSEGNAVYLQSAAEDAVVIYPGADNSGVHIWGGQTSGDAVKLDSNGSGSVYYPVENSGGGLTGEFTYVITIEDAADDEPIQNANVRLYRSGHNGSELTDIDGEASFGLDAATWNYVVSASGYTSATGSFAVTADGARTIQLESIVVVLADAPLTNVTLPTEDQYGTRLPNVTVKFTFLSHADGATITGTVLNTPAPKASDEDGICLVQMRRLANYKAEYTIPGDRQPKVVLFTTGDTGADTVPGV